MKLKACRYALIWLAFELAKCFVRVKTAVKETKAKGKSYVPRESNLIIFQQDATYSVYYISVGSSTCFGRWHPSSGAGTAVNTASGID